MESRTASQLIIRLAQKTDAEIEAIHQLIRRAYPDFPPYPHDMIRAQINSFPEGHFVAEFGGEIAGYCASILLPEAKALAKHTWREITGGGYGTTHDPKGDYLYGYEVCVDQKYRRKKIGQRFYRERKKLCEYHHLKGITFAGRVPNYKRYSKKVNSIEEYIDLVKAKKVRDPVLSFQLRNGFEILGVLPDYLPSDQESRGYATHLLWRNPSYVASQKTTTQSASRTDSVRLAAIQYKQRAIQSFDEFQQIVTYFVDVVADYQADFVLFPELFTLQLLSIENEQIPPHEAIAKVSAYTEQLKEMFRRLAVDYNINIIAGSHPVKNANDTIHNVAFIYLRDGSVHEQAKIHPTPNEQYWWNFEGGNELSAIDTDCGPIGVLICYDAEFPELGRHLVNQGANILFVPFLTDERKSYNRVRYCAHARAIENQCYVVMAGNVGNLPRVQNMDIHYAESCILTPCDFSFARDGIAADTTPNVETVSIADVRLDSLYRARQNGTVKNLQDRRHDLYSVVWHPKLRTDAT